MDNSPPRKKRATANMHNAKYQRRNRISKNAYERWLETAPENRDPEETELFEDKMLLEAPANHWRAAEEAPHTPRNTHRNLNRAPPIKTKRRRPPHPPEFYRNSVLKGGRRRTRRSRSG